MQTKWKMLSDFKLAEDSWTWTVAGIVSEVRKEGQVFKATDKFESGARSLAFVGGRESLFNDFCGASRYTEIHATSGQSRFAGDFEYLLVRCFRLKQLIGCSYTVVSVQGVHYPSEKNLLGKWRYVKGARLSLGSLGRIFMDLLKDMD